MAKASFPIVLILGQDSFRADRALAEVLESRSVEPSEVLRFWGDESSFAEVFSAVTSRSLFSPRTVVLVRRAEKLRGGGRNSEEETEEAVDSDSFPEPAPGRPRGRKSGAGNGPASAELPDIDPSSLLILLVRKADRRLGMWKKLSKAAEVIDADYLKGRPLSMAASAEARALGLRVPEDLLRDIVEQSGPSLGRIVSELEKLRLYEGDASRSGAGVLAVTSSPPLYRLSDAIMMKDKKEALGLLDEALRQGEAGLRVLAAAHGTVRKLAAFRSLRHSGVSSSEAGVRSGILPFKVSDTERAARAWSKADIGRALSVFAEADRRLKLSAPATPLLSHALVRAAGVGRA